MEERLIRSRILKVLNRTLGTEITREEFEAVDQLDQLVGLDSIAMLEFVFGLEGEFDCRFEPENLEYEAVNRLDRLTDLLQS